MPSLRTFEISYTKDGQRKTFTAVTENLYDHDEWRLVAQRFYIVLKDQDPEDKTPQTWKSLCLDAGYTDVSFLEIP